MSADPVSDVVEPLAAPGEELAHGRVRRQRLEQLDVARPQRTRPRHRRSPDPASMASRTPCSSFTSRLATSRPNVAWYNADGPVQVAAGDADVIEAGQQR